MWNYGMHGAGWGWGIWVLLALGTIAFWVAVAWFVRTLIQDRPRREAGGPVGGPGALRILDERLARGEIDLQEYQRLRDVLTDRRR